MPVPESDSAVSYALTIHVRRDYLASSTNQTTSKVREFPTNFSPFKNYVRFGSRPPCTQYINYSNFPNAARRVDLNNPTRFPLRFVRIRMFSIAPARVTRSKNPFNSRTGLPIGLRMRWLAVRAKRTRKKKNARSRDRSRYARRNAEDNNACGACVPDDRFFRSFRLVPTPSNIKKRIVQFADRHTRRRSTTLRHVI